jgi:magnesium chelatase family protein
MSLAVVLTRANIGIEAPLVRVEAHLSNGLPGFSIVGLPETAVKESKERVRSAILNAQLDFPDKRITINLAPADLPKSGGRYDLAIAIGILVASGLAPAYSLADREFLGELALSGDIRSVNAVLPALLAARGVKHSLVIPGENRHEAGLVENPHCFWAGHLLEVLGDLCGKSSLPTVRKQPDHGIAYPVDMRDIVGQHVAKRALTIAAAGGHNLLMQGPPGTGKTLLASRIPTILPLLDEKSALEVAAVRSISAQGVSAENWRVPPFRSPHHTASAVALVGGGSALKVGEVSMAHHGVLFLDELPEFSPKVLEAMREPLEAGEIAISRASYQVRLPAAFQLIAAMNPCPCGYLGDPDRPCRCSPDRVRQYQSRVSGPLLDRIDLHLEVPRLNERDRAQLLTGQAGEGEYSTTLREQVTGARQRQLVRCGKINARLSQAEIRTFCGLKPSDENYLAGIMTRLKLSTRAYFRLLKMARTIADLDKALAISRPHLLEAVSYRFHRHQD